MVFIGSGDCWPFGWPWELQEAATEGGEASAGGADETRRTPERGCHRSDRTQKGTASTPSEILMLRSFLPMSE